MKDLNPTLWRTCRVLSNPHRLALLGLLFRNPDQNVSSLARQTGIGISQASQELRRLQSRGLLQRTGKGTSVFFLPAPDPQVLSAAPLLEALRLVMDGPDADVHRLASIAKGLGHERRIQMVRELGQSPKTLSQLSLALHTTPVNVRKHLAILNSGGWVQKVGRQITLPPPSHPLMAALRRLM